MDGDLDFAKELVDKYSGSGETYTDEDGNWNRKEKITADKIIGTHVDPSTGLETRTNKAMIVYSKTGTHIYPRRKKE